MPFDLSGNYTLPQSPFVTNTVISSAAVNSDFSDIASALSSVGANIITLTADVATLAGAGSGPLEYLVASGAANTYAATSSDPTTGLITGRPVLLKINTANTAASTFNLALSGGSSLGAKAIKVFYSGVGESDPAAGMLQASGIYLLVYNPLANAAVGAWVIEGSVASAATSAFTTGDAKITIKTTADPGWIMMNDGTIGSATSGASTLASATASDLFTLLWNNVSDTYAPVVGGRGGSAAIDWAANKKITLTKQLGRALAIGGAGSGLTARTLGQTLGEETHLQTTAELATHTHTTTEPGTYNKIAALGGGGLANFNFSGPDTAIAFSINTEGSSTPFNVMQPTSFWNVMIKL